MRISAQTTRSVRCYSAGSNAERFKKRQERVLTGCFSHLGVNVFAATCETPTCFEFTTRVLAQHRQRRQESNHRFVVWSATPVANFLEDLARVPLPHSSSILMISGRRAAHNRVAADRRTQPLSPRTGSTDSCSHIHTSERNDHGFYLYL